MLMDQNSAALTAWPADWTGSAIRPIGLDQAFNGYLAANVVFALDRLGLWTRLVGHDAVDIRAFCRETGADERMTGEILRAAAACGYLDLRPGSAALTTAGHEMARYRGYFTWAVGGYGDVFARASGIVTGELAFGEDVCRDESMVALGSGQNDRALMSGILDDVLAGVEFDTIADLGSGTSARLCRIVADRPGARGLGLDISAAATTLAEGTIHDVGLQERVHAVQADVLDVVDGRRPAMAGEVDVVMSFFLLHDLLADPRTRRQTLPRLRDAFPRTRTFVLTDTMLRPSDGGEQTLPVFSVGYELAHALMGVPLHTRETYEELFAAAGLHVQRVEPFATPHSWLYVLDAD